MFREVSPPIPWESKGYKFNGLLEKTIVLVEIYNQQFRGTIVLMVFDFQGIEIRLQDSSLSHLHIGPGS